MDEGRRDFLKKGLVAMGAIAGLTQLVQCTAILKDDPVLGKILFDDENKKQGSFFTCNYWLDKNQDGLVGNDEYVGVKDDFRANESITLVANIPGQRGNYLTTLVWGSNGQKVLDSTTVINFDPCVVRNGFGPWELYKKGGNGIYTAQWHLNSNLVATKNFRLRN